jgi:hypothetical protein
MCHPSGNSHQENVTGQQSKNSLHMVPKPQKKISHLPIYQISKLTINKIITHRPLQKINSLKTLSNIKNQLQHPLQSIITS